MYVFISARTKILHSGDTGTLPTYDWLHLGLLVQVSIGEFYLFTPLDSFNYPAVMLAWMEKSFQLKHFTPF